MPGATLIVTRTDWRKTTRTEFTPSRPSARNVASARARRNRRWRGKFAKVKSRLLDGAVILLDAASAKNGVMQTLRDTHHAETKTGLRA